MVCPVNKTTDNKSLGGLVDVDVLAFSTSRCYLVIRFQRNRVCPDLLFLVQNSVLTLPGMAVLEACKQLNERLQPIKDAHPNEDFKSWVNKAWLDRINLSAQGFWKVCSA